MLAKESAYKVSVLTQPSAPSQTCAVTQDSGSIVAANITGVAVACTTNIYSVGVNITGLASAVGLVLQLNNAHDLPISANGTFKFDTSIPSASPYSVSVLTSPAMPSQTCIVTQGTGTVIDANIDAVAITCATNAYSVSGSVSGLAGSGLVLQNNKGDNLTLGVPANGNANFNFAIAVASGNPYNVSVLTQPSSPTQTCAVTNASGTIGGAGVANVAVACSTNTYSVGGNVVGLTGSGLVLNNNGIPITLNVGNSFALTLASGKTYNIGVTTPPSYPAQVCSVSNGSGTVTSANVSNISVTCSTSSFSMGGSVSGLAAGTSVVLQNNNGDSLTVSSNSAFTFVTSVASGAKYSVSVLTQPSTPSQTCTVANGAGSIGNAAVTNVAVTCVINNFTVGGSITGLSGTGLVLRNNGTDNLTVAANSGSFTFATAVASNAPYSVAVLTQPNNPSQTCSVTGGSGTVTTASITNISISCTTNTYTVSGSVTGLTGTGLVLQNNGADNYAVSANGTFSFTTKIASNGKYAVTVSIQPGGPAQTCSVTNGSGTVTNSNISNVVVNCVINSYTVSSSVTGLAGNGLALTNYGAPLTLTNNAFSLTLASGTAYKIEVATHPSTPTQTCVVTNGMGTITNANVTNIAVACTTNTYTIGGMITGLSGTGLAVQNNFGDNLAVAANSGAFTFKTALASGTSYSVTVLNQPNNPPQTCIITNGGGPVTNAKITSVGVSCTTNSYLVTAAVTGLVGTGLVLLNNATTPLTNTAGTYYSISLVSGSSYSISVGTPPSPAQQCVVDPSNAAGIVSLQPITVRVTCLTPGQMGGSIQSKPLNLSNTTVNATTFVGVHDGADGQGATARFRNPNGVVAVGGDLYVADTDNWTIRKIDAAGNVTTFAGKQGVSGRSDGIVSVARFSNPSGITATADGKYLYVSDSTDIRQIDLTVNPPMVSTITTTLGYGSSVGGIATDGVNIYQTSFGSHVILKIDIVTKVISELAGTKNTTGSADGVGTAATFYNPAGLTLVGTYLYVSDYHNSTIRQVTTAASGTIPAGTVTTVVGTVNVRGVLDGNGTAAQLYLPVGITNDGAFLYVTDMASSVRKIQIGGQWSVNTLAGRRSLGSADGPGVSATFDFQPGSGISVHFIASQSQPVLYVADSYNNTIRSIDTTTTTNTVATLAGTPGARLDGVRTAARFNRPLGITTDGTSLYVADNSNSSIRKIDIQSQAVTTLMDSTAGRASDQITTDGVNLYFGANGVVLKMDLVTKVITTLATVNSVGGITTDGKNLYVSDSWVNAIMQIDLSNNAVTTLAGVPTAPFANGSYVDDTNNTPGTATFNYPQGITTNGKYVYVADTNNYRIRQIDLATKLVTTLAGTGAATYFDTMDGPATSAKFASPVGISSDGSNLYVADGNTVRIVTLNNTTDTVTTLSGAHRTTSNPYNEGFADGTGALASYNVTAGITNTGSAVYVVDRMNSTIRQLN